MTPCYIFVRVKKAIESRFLMLEQAFSWLERRENVNIRLFIFQKPQKIKKSAPLQQKKETKNISYD